VTLYPARDYSALGGVPGCDTEHVRPVHPHTGQPVHPWGIECAAHQAFYTGASRPKVLKYITDKKTGTVISQQRVPDAHPGFSTTPDTVPLTYDEMQSRDRKLELGENQLRALESLVALKAGGVDLTSRPDVMYFLQESGLPAEMLQGKTVCAGGHDNPAGLKFCGECGVSMAVRAAVEAPAPAPGPAVDITRLHPQTLRKMCRERGLADKGSKDQLLQRLAA